MISSIGKVALTGFACGALGLGLGAVWASQARPGPGEPLRRLVQPPSIAPAQQDRASTAEVRSSAAPKVVAEPLAANPALLEPAGGDVRAEPRRGPQQEPREASEELSVKRLVVTDRIQGREPANAAELRADGSEVFAFVELSNPGSEEQRIEIVFEHQSGQQVGFIKLPVPRDSSRWRTWGQTRQIKKGGHWVARVRSEDGTELMTQRFTVGQS